MSGFPAVFLDRDGVIVADVGLVACGPLRLLPGVPAALRRLATAGYLLPVVTNQTVISRGVVTEQDLERQHDLLQVELSVSGGPPLSGFWICPHHPHAQVPKYRQPCFCRKPRPGLILAAARELGIDLVTSWLVGDRPSDIAAGRRSGCRTVLVRTGHHCAEPIVGAESLGSEGLADHEAENLDEAAEFILRHPT